MQIAKVQAISEKRGDAYRVIKQAYTDLKNSYGKLNQRIVDLSIGDANLRGISDELRGIIDLGYTNVERLGNL